MLMLVMINKSQVVEHKFSKTLHRKLSEEVDVVVELLGMTCMMMNKVKGPLSINIETI